MSVEMAGGTTQLDTPNVVSLGLQERSTAEDDLIRGVDDC